ncbi:ABC transporter ATP-binding protein/permease [Traorella massiliensis]|uniref:ABC transporter ATP-binding protein/permease n=1 Tax=Traorella massiliensis TaxID=1903263 RepID=UPI002357EA13|nr:ABC transporter ATP-binding protein/permease [Traorella massiliensis]
MLQIKNIYKEYKTGNLVQKALDGVSFNLRDNEFVAVLGPSGSGKTTMLNIIGGLDRYDSGDLIINGISTKNYKDKDWDSYRNHTIGFVFQSYNLIPHQSVLSNVELALTISGISKNERRKRALQALDEVGLKEQSHKKPNQLSGGQMQRVAIARALVNDPDILLADEPTGALDSDTSIQVMDLLKEVAKDRLVVMVTHNPELAEAYATRIIKLRDGKILSDSNPFAVDESSLEKPQHKNMGKSSMSLLTALALSFNNLKTKKGRTLLTSFAGSIGIIGISLILSLSNGVSTYISNIEEETLSEYPLELQSSGFDMTAMFSNASSQIDEEQQGEIKVNEMLTNIFSKVGSNDLASLKRYLEEDESGIDEYVKAIEYEYNIVPQIYSINDGEIRQVNPDSSFAALGFSSTNTSNSMVASMTSTDVFAAMPANTDLFADQYDMKAGHWPQNYNECVLVLSSRGSISDFLLYTLGLRDYDDLDAMIRQFAANENVTVPENTTAYDYDDILGLTFKLINAYDQYQYDEEYQIWVDKSDDDAYMKEVVEKGENLTIVGIVQPKEGTTAAMLTSGIYYPASLTSHLIEEAANSPIVQSQLASPQIDVFTGNAFGEESETSFDLSSIFSINTDVLQSAFIIDESRINIDMTSLNEALANISLPSFDLSQILSQIEFDLPEDALQGTMEMIITDFQNYLLENTDIASFPQQFEEYLSSQQVIEKIQHAIEGFIEENGSINITSEQLQSLFMEILEDYQKYASANDMFDITQLDQYFSDYIHSEETKQMLSSELSTLLQESGIEAQFAAAMQQAVNEAMASLSTTIQQEMTNMMTQLSSSMADAIRFDADVFADAIEIKMSENDLAQLLSSMSTRENVSYENNLQKLGYADIDNPYSINIYPKDFESKEEVLGILDQYNTNMEMAGKEDQVVTYMDLVGTLMTSVTDIINVISYVLIAFVAISLVVSSIMIGVITYISVLERKKEIGILRAIGASKRNISQVFNAETFIIGLCAGLMGILITLLLLIPGNQIIHSIAGQENINAILPVGAAIILVLLSVVLTLIGGLIPSRKAAKEDPVIALRTD